MSSIEKQSGALTSADVCAPAGCPHAAKASVSRRKVLVGALGLASLTQCSRRPQPGNEPRVSIVPAQAYDQRVYDIVRRLLADHKLDVRGKRVLLKPNLVEFDPEAVINTNPLLIHAALEAFAALGASDVRIAEGPGHRRPTLDLAEAAGYFRMLSNFERLFTDLNLDTVSLTELRRRESPLKSLYLPDTVLSCDLLVSMPKMKTHHWVGVTLGLKNLFGIVPSGVYGWPKNVLHWAGIDESIVDLYATVPPAFTIVDGIEGMEGNGPIQGRSRHAGVIVAGRDAVAVDATCCRIMDIDPQRIRYLELAAALGQTEERNVRQIGAAITAVQTTFELLPEFRGIRLS